MAIFRATVTISSAALGGTGTNTFHARTTSDLAPFDSELSDVSEILQDFYTAVAPWMPTPGCTVAFDGSWTGVGPTEGTFETTTPWSVEGAAGDSNTMPPANCICVNWVGSAGDRSKRGRTFLGPLNPSAMDADGSVGGGTLTDIRAAAAAYVTASQGLTGAALGIWSREESVFRDVVTSSVRDQFAVLRSRRD